jgi:hypothetical protein
VGESGDRAEPLKLIRLPSTLDSHEDSQQLQLRPPPLLSSLTGQVQQQLHVCLPAVADNATLEVTQPNDINYILPLEEERSASAVGVRCDHAVLDPPTCHSRPVTVEREAADLAPTHQLQSVGRVWPCSHCGQTIHINKNCLYPRPYPPKVAWPPPLNLEPPGRLLTEEEPKRWAEDAALRFPKLETKSAHGIAVSPTKFAKFFSNCISVSI